MTEPGSFAERLRAGIEAATPGPWDTGGFAIDTPEGKIGEMVTHEKQEADSELICLLVNNAEAILRLIEAATRWSSEQGPGMHVNTVVGRSMTRNALAALDRGEVLTLNPASSSVVDDV